MKKEEILFKRGIKIQGLNRIAIPKELLENMKLEEGDKIALFYDKETGSIIIKKDRNKK